MMNFPVIERLVALQSTQELERKSVKSTRRGYRKGRHGKGYDRATVENRNLGFRKMDEDAQLNPEKYKPTQAFLDMYPQNQAK